MLAFFGHSDYDMGITHIKEPAFVLRKQFPKDNGLGFLAAVLESLSTVRYAQAAAIMLITKGFKRERVFSQNSGRL